MRLILFRHLWGVDGAWEAVFPRFAAAGYRGIESRLPEPADRGRFRDLLQQHGFEYIPQIFTAGENADEHLASFRAQLEEALTLRPRFVNSHSGRDAFSADESGRFFAGALKIEADLGVRVVHETHRGRMLFNPWITAAMLDRFDGLRLCCDYSHWVCVCERLIDDQLPIIRQAAARCLHLHARVGYEQGPQVPDPRAPEYQRHLEAHERWWDIVWQAQQARDDAESTLTPEFGPPLYQHTLPFTDVPVSNLWAICDWQAQRQAERFGRCVQ